VAEQKLHWGEEAAGQCGFLQSLLVDGSAGDNSGHHHLFPSNHSQPDDQARHTEHSYDQSRTIESHFRLEDLALAAEEGSHLAHH
jgi:hypothetical protein